MLEVLKTGNVDLAIAGPLGHEWDRLDRWTLFDDIIEVVVGQHHPLAARERSDSLALAQLAPETLLGHIDCDFHDGLAECLSGAGLALEPSHWVATDHDLLSLVSTNEYVGMVPANAPRSDLTRRIKLEDAVVMRPVAVYAVAGRHRPPAVTSFLNLLRSANWSA